MVWQGHIPRRQRKTNSGGQKGRFIEILLLDHETTKSWPQLISRHVWVYLGPRNPGSDSLAPQRWSRPKNLQLDISTILPRRRPAIPHSSVAATINQVTSEFHSHWESRDHPAGEVSSDFLTLGAKYFYLNTGGDIFDNFGEIASTRAVKQSKYWLHFWQIRRDNNWVVICIVGKYWKYVSVISCVTSLLHCCG